MEKNNEIVVRKVGRPTDYRPEYCQMLMDHMSKGLSFESFAGVLVTTKATLYNWTELFPEFLYSKQIGTELNRLFYEQEGIKGMINETPFFNDRVWRLNMLNRFRDDWSENQNIKHEVTEVKKSVIRFGDTDIEF